AANHVDFASWHNGLDGALERILGTFHEQAGLFIYVADQEGGVVIAMDAADVGGDVDVDDVPVFQHRGVGDAVANDLVQRGAQRLGESAVAQGRRVGVVVHQELVADAVQLIGGDSGLAGLADFLQRLSGNFRSYADAFDDFRAFDFRSRVGCRFFLANILGTFNMFRYRKFRGYRSGGEISNRCSRCS